MGKTGTVLLTGGTGFVGSALVRRLRGCYRLVLASRRADKPIDDIGYFSITNLDADVDWRAGLKGVDVVIHAAARVHVMNEQDHDPLATFRRTNVEATLNLARQAAEAGVRRFIFISSIKVCGEGTSLGRPYIADGVPAPADPYGQSKHEAEQGLGALARETGLEVVIIRPPLVYGPGVKANFLSMMNWLHWGVPLPFGAIGNKRSLVALDNLADLVATCIHHPRAANQIFLVSDGHDLSTTELLRCMANAMGVRPHLLPVPSWLLEACAAVLGKRALSQRLCGTLQVDIGKTHELLGWTPPLTMQDALLVTAKDFLARK